MGAHQDGDLFKDLADAAFRKPVPAREATRLLALMFALAGVVVASQDQSSSRFIVLIFSALGIVVWFVAWRTDPKRVPVKSEAPQK